MSAVFSLRRRALAAAVVAALSTQSVASADGPLTDLTVEHLSSDNAVQQVVLQEAVDYVDETPAAPAAAPVAQPTPMADPVIMEPVISSAESIAPVYQPTPMDTTYQAQAPAAAPAACSCCNTTCCTKKKKEAATAAMKGPMVAFSTATTLVI